MTKKLLISVILLLGFWTAGLAAFCYRIYHFETDTGTQTDAIIALTGGKNRISEAVELLNDGKAEKLFISGVQKNISLDELVKRPDITLKTTREITLDKKSTNTVENAKETVEWIKNNKISSIRLVTSNYHMLRSEEEFEALDPQLKIIRHPVYSENVSAMWWKNIGSFCLLASEYNKFLFVYARNRLTELFN